MWWGCFRLRWFVFVLILVVIVFKVEFECLFEIIFEFVGIGGLLVIVVSLDGIEFMVLFDNVDYICGIILCDGDVIFGFVIFEMVELCGFNGGDLCLC